MAKQWISVLGENHTSGYPADGATLEHVDWVKKTDSRLESGGVYSSVANLAGSRGSLNAIKGMCLRGVRWTALLEASYTVPGAIGGDPFNASSGNWFVQATPDQQQVVLRVVADLPGELPQVMAIGAALPTANGSAWGAMPSGWTFERSGLAIARFIEYTPTRMLPGVEHNNWYARATHSLQYAPVLPIGLVRANADALDPNQWGGALASLLGMVSKGSAYARFTKLEYLVSERPTWSAEINTLLTMGAADNGKLKLKLYFPDGNEPVAGVPIRVLSQSGRVTFKPPGGAWATSITLLTDENGTCECPLQAAAEGADTVHIEYAGIPNIGGVFQPSLRSRGQQVFIASGSSQAPPDPADPAAEVTCTVIPAVQGQPYIPPRTEYSPNFGWNAGALSVEEVAGDAFLRATMGKVVGVAWGIGPVDRLDPRRDVARIAHGWMFQQESDGTPIAVVVESGTAVSSKHAHTSTTLFEIRRLGSTVVYLIDNQLVHTSRHELTGPIMAVSSLYATGDGIE